MSVRMIWLVGIGSEKTRFFLGIKKIDSFDKTYNSVFFLFTFQQNFLRVVYDLRH